MEKALKHYIDTAKQETMQILDTLNLEMYQDAVELIENARKNNKRLHMTGIGKPSYVGAYMASLLSSTGTPCYVLDATEAVHGSSGQVLEGDVVICISNSGNTDELKRTVETLKRNKAKIISVSGNDQSFLAKEADVFLKAQVSVEGGPLNRAPRTSILAELIVLQGLSVILQELVNVSPEQYVKWHPGGTLGQLREDEKKC